MTLTPERAEAIVADQERINAQAIARGALENPLELPTPRAGSNGNGLQKTEPLIRIRTAAEVAARMPRSEWLLRPYLERNAIAFLYGDYGTYKSFVCVDWGLRVALGMPALGYSWRSQQSAVVLVSAEGRALTQRIRAWCIQNRPDEPFARILDRTPLYCIEQPINLSSPQGARALVDAIDKEAIRPGLMIIDTMTRNSDGRIEESTACAGGYLAIVDQDIRSRYQCAVVLTHHVGHTEKGRMRGPIVLAGNTDVLIRIERPAMTERLATLTVDRLKDSDRPAPQRLRARVVDIGESDSDGQPVTSLALEAIDTAPASVVATLREPRGKAQRRLLAALRAENAGAGSWTEGDLREVGRKLPMHKNTARDAAKGLMASGYMIQTADGWRLAEVCRTEKTEEAEKERIGPDVGPNGTRCL